MVESFESYRSYLFAIAYRMLGSAMDAQDMVQETYLRYSATPPETITSLKAFLTTIITRLCMDQLHLARRKRDVYLGPWLPEPLITPEALEAVSLEERVDMEESISLAFLLLLEQLQPIERAVFLLREVFEYDYAEIASFLRTRYMLRLLLVLQPHDLTAKGRHKRRQHANDQDESQSSSQGRQCAHKVDQGED